MRNPLALLPAAFLLAACGDTHVTVELTDAPPDTASIDHVFITLSRVEVHVAGGDDDDKDKKSEVPADPEDGEGSWRTVAVPAGTFDLIALQNDVRATLGELDLPSGKITQIRLFIDAAGKNQVELTSGETCALDTTAVPTTGVKINHPFKAIDVEDSSELKLVVDFDLAESVDQSGSCSFALRPVIKLKAVEKD